MKAEKYVVLVLILYSLCAIDLSEIILILLSLYGKILVININKRGIFDSAIVVELKWKESKDTAIRQIKAKNYPTVLKGYCGEVILVGIDYNAKIGKHSCSIEKISM